ncbi:MAG: DUF460 domain-containing protein [Candidatus Syntropharchaeia archaeon]
MDARTIVGVDISKRSKHGTSYALTILKGDSKRYASVSFFKLLRLINRLKPDIVATDNIYELAESKKSIVSFLRRLPPETKLIQVTGKGEKLTRIAKRYGISFDRLNPLEEAEACALLASMGVGYEVLAFEDRTRIKISRARSLGKGGWSQKRYGRKVHGAVKSCIREMKKILEDGGHEYTLEVKKGYGGYVRGVFIVNTPRERLNISSARYRDVQISVDAVERNSIDFVPLSRQKREYLIVGIDPGTTTGVAALDLEGKLVSLFSSRTTTLSEIIALIASLGRPLLITSDVTPAPTTVKKVKSAFNAILYEGEESLSIQEKINLTRSFHCKNDHERDALAAAIRAFKGVKNKFAQIEKKIPGDIDANEVKALVLRGLSIERALSTMKKEEKEEKIPEEEKEKKEKSALELVINHYEERISHLKDFVSDLKKLLEEKDREIEHLNSVINEIKSERKSIVLKSKEIQKREKEIISLKKELRKMERKNSELMKQIDRLKRMRMLEISGRGRPLKIIHSFTKDGIIHGEREYGIKKGDLIFLEDASGGGSATAEMLVKRGVLAIIYEKEMSHFAAETFFKEGLPFFSSKEIPIQRVDNFAMVDPEILNEKIKEWKKEREKKEKQKKEKEIESLLAEYRVERKGL